MDNMAGSEEPDEKARQYQQKRREMEQRLHAAYGSWGMPRGIKPLMRRVLEHMDQKEQKRVDKLRKQTAGLEAELEKSKTDAAAQESELRAELDRAKGDFTQERRKEDEVGSMLKEAEKDCAQAPEVTESVVMENRSSDGLKSLHISWRC